MHKALHVWLSCWVMMEEAACKAKATARASPRLYRRAQAKALLQGDEMPQLMNL